MSDTKWGFEKSYGHKVLPYKWHQSSNFASYSQEPFKKKSFRPSDMPVYRDSLAPQATHYAERKQTSNHCMSSYGCHREMPWDDSLRSPRNPFPGSTTRETKYLKEPTPASTARSGMFPQLATPRRNSGSRCSSNPIRRTYEPSGVAGSDYGDDISAAGIDHLSTAAQWRTEPRILPPA